MGNPQPAQMDADAFLAWEAEQPEKHEFVAGEVFAMGGASDRHVTISLNVASALREHLRGGPCRTFIADMKLRVEAADAFFYPDVMVTCDPQDRGREQYKQAPLLVVEVLSPSTEAFDRGAKFAAYRSLASLQEYLMIDPASGAVELYRRDPEDHWVLYTHEACDATGRDATGDAVELRSVGLTLEGGRIFEDAPPDTAPPASEA
ncbi:Uma2 family endonuclease [Thioalkalivibrio sp. ALE21]|uniref:Uma2 family endonuclease n=1 Tax=Thioalkalivibrio sp. ALE21 TaxID=1158175 RepID=UPI000D89CB5E|nr:Uma2 family endonuclease [Thioalkalivibrio sp. ALE21]PYG04432.1 Uma2 family endonuclease [Thioalkalivibrio sp. ALE21]